MTKNAFAVLMLGGLLMGNAPATPVQSSATIRARYTAVERELPRCQVVKRELSGYSLEGGELTAYFQGGVPRKLVARHFGESGRATEEYYFWQGKLFFVLRTNWNYEKPISQSGSTGRQTRFQQRLYFQNRRLTRWLDDAGRPRPIRSPEAAEIERQYLQSARDFLGKVRGK